MRKTLGLILFFSFSYGFSQNIIQFKISKPYCLLNFLQSAVNSGGGTSSTLSKFIWERLGSDAEAKKIFNEYKTIRLDYTFVRDEFPEKRHRYRSTTDLIMIAAVKANSLDEFKTSTIGILPNNEHQKLITLLKKAEPFYDKIIWNDQKEKLEKQKSFLENYKKQCDELFDRFKRFYNTSWNNDLPFIVALYPIPGKGGNSTATPHANSLCVGVMTEETDHESRIGVIIHEMCHVLYDEQPNSFQFELENLFLSSNSDYAPYAHNFFDEGLATAIGNGYTYKFIKGKPDTSAWYDNIYINGFAKRIFSLTENYLENKKNLDSSFVNTAIKLFGDEFPRSIYDYGILLNEVHIYADYETPAEREEKFGVAYQYFSIYSSFLSTPVNDEVSLDKLKTSSGTQLIIIEKDHQKNMDALKKILTDLPDYTSVKNNDFVLNYYDVKKRPILLIHLKDPKNLDKVLKSMSVKRFFNDKERIVKID